MNVTYEPSTTLEGALIAHLGGTFDANAAIELWETVSQRVDDETRFVVFDFSEITILTSAGIGILVRLFTRLKSYGGGLAIFGCNSKVREVFSIVMLDTILKVCETDEEAWESLRNGAPA